MAVKKVSIADVERMIEEDYPEFLTIASLLTRKEMNKIEKYIDPRYREIVRYSFRLITGIKDRIKRLIGYYNISAEVLDLHFNYSEGGDVELLDFTIMYSDDFEVNVIPSCISLKDLDKLEDIAAESLSDLNIIRPC